ncbi:uncharacterized protein ddias isoform X2 [Salminus brasiliensis]|uniref:uncharacterized protein ddias isoform X2 n=1 Tax=Salminus brasiliensis TaxID=930266 RepID=UPI003B82EBE2
MNHRKVLVNCTVIALQDTRLLYPCCNFCLSRSAEEAGLSRCIKCGFTCERQNVDYRYRLSLKVSRGRNIFGVTVFGGCLNSFFGVTASDLQRFVDSGKPEGQHSSHQLLIKAVEDCFIGRNLVFGFKLSGLEAESCLLNEHTLSLGSGAESAQLVACQILSPNGAFLGMTVFAYLQSIWQANHSASQETVCQSLQKDSLLNSSEYTLPLCVRSNLETSGVGLTQLWDPASDMVLCFSPEETSGHSLHRVTSDDGAWILSRHVTSPGPRSEPQWPVKELSFMSESQTDQVLSSPGVPYAEDTETSERIESRGETDTGCSISIDKLHSPVALISNPLNTVSCGYQPARSVSVNHCSLRELPHTEHNTSGFEESLLSKSGPGMSFALEDAPLSESLGSFVSIEPHISVAVDRDVIKPTNKCKTRERNQTTPRKPNCPLTPLHNVTNVIREKDNERSWKRMYRKRKILPSSKPCLPVTPKVSRIPEDSGLDSCDIKDMVSNSLTKNPVSMAFRLQRDQRGNSSKDTIMQAGHAVCPEMQSQGMKEQESPSGGHREEYNCSADLFCQSSVDINSPNAADRAASDPKKIKNVCLSDDISKHKISTSFYFAPSLQSTPVAHPYDRWIYRQGHTPNRKCLDLPCLEEQVTHTHVRVLGNHSSTIQESKTGKPGLNQIQSSEFGNSDSGCASEVHRGVEQESEDVSPTDTNEWSRDLFSNSF